MGLLVPYDGSALSKAALIRAEQFDAILDEGVTALTVIPESNRQYARDRGWIGPDETYTRAAVVANLERSVSAISPNAVFEFVTVGRSAPYGTIANRIRRYARDADVSILFLGSENAGRMVGS
ncbi:universal stress protein [Halobaculum lipolyticum]|nr:universal stress protein [Halobaculum sp. DT31]